MPSPMTNLKVQSDGTKQPYKLKKRSIRKRKAKGYGQMSFDEEETDGEVLMETSMKHGMDKEHPEKKAGPISILFFNWVSPILRQGAGAGR